MSYLKVNEIKVGDIAPTKFGIELMADAIQEQVNEGLLDPLELAIKFNGLEQLVKSVKSRITENVLSELMKHPKGKAEVLGASVSQMDSIKYDFTDLPGWLELEEQIMMLKEKQLLKFLQQADAFKSTPIIMPIPQAIPKYQRPFPV